MLYEPADLPIDSWYAVYKFHVGDGLYIDGTTVKWRFLVPRFWWWVMGITPEGKVKKAVVKLLERYRLEGLYHFMPVPSGYGESSLDFIGCFKGKFFAIETKAPGKKPSALQERMIERMIAAGGMAFVIDGVEDQHLIQLRLWLEAQR